MNNSSRTQREITVRLAAVHWQRLRGFHLAPGKRRETLSYLWGRTCRVRGGLVILVPHDAPCLMLGDDCYLRSSGAQVTLQPDVLNGMLVEFARSDYDCLINVHDHWFSDSAEFSSVDDEDDLRFDRYLRSGFEPSLARCEGLGRPRKVFNLSVVLGQDQCQARMVDTQLSVPFQPVAKVALLGERWACVPLTGRRAASVPGSDWMSRQAGILGADGVGALQALHVGIVGCGGLGSIQAELLARLGIGRLTLVDGDHLDHSNLNRWQGGRPEWVGRPKARVLAEHLGAMVPGCKVQAVPHVLSDFRSQLALASVDIVLAGVDNDEARYVLNHFAVQHMQPYFDLGVVIDGTPEAPDFAGRYFAVVPGVTGCAECKAFDLLDRDAVVRGFANAAVVGERQAAGYLLDRPDVPTPSAYMLNQRTAALGAQELTNFVTGWRPLATVIQERWRSGAMQRADRGNYPEQPDPECPVCSFRIGRGWSVPLPSAGQTLAAATLRAIEADLQAQPAAVSLGAREESVHAAVAPERGTQSASLAPGVDAAESGPPQVSSTDSLKETLA